MMDTICFAQGLPDSRDQHAKRDTRKKTLWHPRADGCEMKLKKSHTQGTGSSCCVSAVFRDGNVEVLLDGCENDLVVSPDCLEIDSAENALSLATFFMERGFCAASLNIVRTFCAQHAHNIDSLLEISDFLIKLDQFQDAETLLRNALKLDPSVTSSNHLKALCLLAELKRRLGNDDEAICLCEKVLQHEMGPGHQISVAALTCLCLAYENLGDLAEARQLRSRLQTVCASSFLDSKEVSGLCMCASSPFKKRHS